MFLGDEYLNSCMGLAACDLQVQVICWFQDNLLSSDQQMSGSSDDEITSTITRVQSIGKGRQSRCYRYMIHTSIIPAIKTKRQNGIQIGMQIDFRCMRTVL